MTSELRWSLATPGGGAGAIAVIDVFGPVDKLARVLCLPALSPGGIYLGSLLGVDRGIVACWTPGHVQLMPHGGREIARRLASELESRGVARAGLVDPRERYPEAESEIEARMLAALCRAASPRAVDLLLDQPRRWDAPGASDSGHARELARLIDPALIVVLGPPNVGKSTLTNALAGSSVSLVADEPGVTRDHVGVTLNLDGVVVRWADTPGLGPPRDSIDARAQELALHLADKADLVVLVGDGGRPAQEWSGDPACGVVRVCLRADLGVGDWDHDLGVCAPRGERLGELAALIRRRLVPDRALNDPRPWRFWRG